MKLAASNQLRLVVDTNVLVRALANHKSASGQLLNLYQKRKFSILLSRPVLREYRDVLTRPELTAHHPAITVKAVTYVIERLRYFADVVDPVRSRFRYDRDPDDQPFIELAISGAATHLITHDNDLLSLPNSHKDAGKRFRQRLPRIHVCTSINFLKMLSGETTSS